MLIDPLGASQHAGNIRAQLQVIPADGLAVKHRVVGDDFNDLDPRHLQPPGYIVNDFVAEEPDFVLSKKQQRDHRRPLERVAGNNLVKLFLEHVGNHRLVIPEAVASWPARSRGQPQAFGDGVPLSSPGQTSTVYFSEDDVDRPDTRYDIRNKPALDHPG